MRIIHCCLSNFFFENQSYQENFLVDIDQKKKNKVIIIASAHNRNNKTGKYFFIKPKSYYMQNGIKVFRINYVSWLPKKIAWYFKVYENYISIIKNFKPDIIYIHGAFYAPLFQIIKLKKRNPNVKIIIDNHGDYYNSSLNIFSKFINKFYNRLILKLCLKYIDSFLATTRDTKYFAVKELGIPKNKVKYFPLGGLPIKKNEYLQNRKKIKKKFKCERKIILLIAGNLNKKVNFKNFFEIISKIKNNNFLLFICGSYKGLESLIVKFNLKNKVLFLKYIDQDFLKKILCASDIYIQFSQSVLTQQSMFASNALLLNKTKEYHFLSKNCGYSFSSLSELKKKISPNFK